MSCLYRLLCAALLFQHLLALDTLQLLVILPLNSSNAPGRLDGWERGAEMLATAERAVESINQDTGILQGYRLKLSIINSMMCRPPHYRVTVLPQLLDAIFHTRQEVIGAVGMFCYSTAHLLTQIARRPHRKNSCSHSLWGHPHPSWMSQVTH